MGDLFGSSSKKLLKQQTADVEKREKELRRQELLQAKLLAATRKTLARGLRSQTIADQVLGSAKSVKKRTLGEGNI